MGIISPSSAASRIGCAARYAALRVLDPACGRRAEAGYGIQGQVTSGGGSPTDFAELDAHNSRGRPKNGWG